MNYRVYAVFVLGWIAVTSLPAQTLTTLFSFNKMDGANADGTLIQGFDGNLYGTTYGGGIDNAGTVFKITANGLATLYHFCSGGDCADGRAPKAGLAPAADGNLYGVTYYGGVHHNGTVFKITPAGVLTTLHSFCGRNFCTDGAYPVGPLVRSSDGDPYGTTQLGGVHSDGTVFKVTTSGVLTTLYSFCSVAPACADGSQPYAGLIQATDGNFYGTTYAGGPNDSGTMFEITPLGELTTLYGFCSQGPPCSDGSYPEGGLVQASDGNFYGTTSSGGSGMYPSGAGVIFKVTTSGTFTNLYTFCVQSGCPDGQGPLATLVAATDGNLYGTTIGGGAYGNGTAFEITPGGAFTTLYSFCAQSGCTDGSAPFAGLVQATSGDFYGTAVNGGAHLDGTAFRLSVGLGPFVKIGPPSGSPGNVIDVLGTDLTGATVVTFNGIAASFKLDSRSLIHAKVPAGATSGPVQVVTPGGTLTSNVPFSVLP